ncbi:SAP domain-containing ribonucleoprotein isoform X2 [Dermacentor albipictus]|uniref:SAP domain-containing ribonucleoprotein isoform X2 n=1 Tax=Dermacentor albipictus TaxID=60249 RepID=UPI0031FC5E82
MADSVDMVGADSIRNMKVADLKKELKARGLSTAGNKSELAERLEAALGLPKDMSDVQIDEGLDQGVDVNEDEALLEESLLLPAEGKANNGDVFAREEELLATPVTKEPPAAAKLSLEASNLTASSIAAAAPAAIPQKIAAAPTAMEPASNESEAKKVRLKVTALSGGDATAAATIGAPKEPTKGLSVEERISLRSKKFNMPLSDTARLKVRMERFGAAAQNSPAASKDTTKTSSVKLSRTSISANPPPVDLAKLKKRAERFGQSVSTVAKDLEEKERLLKRKQRFNSTPAPDVSKKAKTITT